MIILALFGDYIKGENCVNRLSIGVDIGTTNTKAVLYDENGRSLAHAQATYSLLTPDSDIAEQNPDDILEAVKTVLIKVIRMSHQVGSLSFIALSAQMHSLILVNNKMAPITKSITWADNRAKQCAERLKMHQKGMQIYHNTGTPIHAMSPLCKLLWLKETYPDLFKSAYKMIDIKTYIIYHLTEECVMDMSIASATGFFNIHHKEWDEDALSLIELERHKLPHVVPTTHCLKLTEQVKNVLNLQDSIPLVIGASDGVLSNLGVNSIQPGEVAVTIGTSGAIRTVVKRPVLDPLGRTFCYILDESHYVIGGPVNNGAVTLQWLGEKVLHNPHHMDDCINYEDMLQQANSVPIGSDGLIFHPYLSGERAPIWSSNAKGSFIGLTLAHHQGHLVRAVMEGVLFNLYTVLMTLSQISNVTPTVIKATGGFSKNVLWRQMMSDIFNCQVIFPEDYESSCLGAVILGKKALGYQEIYQNLSHWVGSTFCHYPHDKHVKQYAALVLIFMDIQERLIPTYDSIAALQQQFTNTIDKRDRNDV